MMKIMKIAVFTSGGDAPGMNACIRAIVRKAMHSNIEVVGALLGYDGMINNDFIQLDKSSVGNIIQKGGTILKTARSLDFITVQGRKKAFENIQKNNIDGIVAIGGDGTFSGAAIFTREFGVPVIGIPGTIGGGLRMNAGCFKKEFKDILISIQAIDRLGKVVTIPANKVIFEYRNNDLPNDLIFLSASFKGEKKNKIEIKKEVTELKKRKDSSQPTKIKTSGSTFKNPINQTEKKVWELIKESVPLESAFGDAEISKKHCNFFVNKNNATFEDMNKLIEFVKEKVEKKTGIKLEKEIKILK